VKNHRQIAGRAVRVVALGGGTGLSTLLRGLKEYVARRRAERRRLPISDLAAIVTVTDDGGSSGRLRREQRVDECIGDDRDGDRDIDAQQDQQG